MARRGSWAVFPPCPCAYLPYRRVQGRAPSLLRRFVSPVSTVLWAPRTPAAQHPTSPSAYTACLALTGATQTGLSCSEPHLSTMPPPLPRIAQQEACLDAALLVLPSPRHEKLGAIVVNVTRLQRSLDAAARWIAPPKGALDIPRGPGGSLRQPGICYAALQRLPRRDLHPLVKNSVKIVHFPRARAARGLRQDAPWVSGYEHLFVIDAG